METHTLHGGGETLIVGNKGTVKALKIHIEGCSRMYRLIGGTEAYSQCRLHKCCVGKRTLADSVVYTGSNLSQAAARKMKQTEEWSLIIITTTHL